VAASETHMPLPERGPARRVALVVDDDESIRRLIASALARAGYSCVVASDGAEALSAAAAVRPLVAILDLMLPGMTGVELALEMHRRYPEIALAGISGWPGLWDSTDLRTLGVQKVFGKPFDMKDLISWAAAAGRGVEAGE